jgi:hypothetical protein
MKTLDRAAATLRARQLHMEEENEALETVLRELFRQRDALRFYADKANYLDGVPMMKDDRGLMVTDDEGHTAREALRLNDYYGQPFTRALQEEGNHAPQGSVS